MLNNGNGCMGFNSFKEVPLVPYKILEELILDKSEYVENLWKLLRYTTIDALEKDNLTEEEKDKMIWRGETMEQDFNIFLKPLVSSSLDTSNSQTQLRLYRYNTMPVNRYEAIVTFEIDILVNEKTSLVEYNGMLCERADLIESFLLDILNGRDLKIGSGLLEYNRELSRTCQSLMSINNSKTTYGRSLIFALRYMGGETSIECGC